MKCYVIIALIFISVIISDVEHIFIYFLAICLFFLMSIPLLIFFSSFLLKKKFFLTLQYCIGFAIYQNESAIDIHVFPILNPPPHFAYFLNGSLVFCSARLLSYLYSLDINPLLDIQFRIFYIEEICI